MNNAAYITIFYPNELKISLNLSLKVYPFQRIFQMM